MIKHYIAMCCGSLIVLLAAASAAIADDIVVIMGPAAAMLTKDQVSSVYLGRNTEFKPVDLPESSTVRQAFYKKATERELPQIKAVWTRLTFTGGGQPPKVLPDDAAVKKAVAADPKAIGYIEKSSVDPSIKVVLDLG